MVLLPLFVYHFTVSGLQVKLAIIGVQAGGVGLDFSAAQSVTFVELPKSASEMLQVSLRPLNMFEMNGYQTLDFLYRREKKKSPQHRDILHSWNFSWRWDTTMGYWIIFYTVTNNVSY